MLAAMQARLKFPPEAPVGWYHCLSRVVDRRFIFREAEKDRFVALLRECEVFCEVRVLTFCLMSNHFHILVEVPAPPPPEQRPSPEQVCAKLDRLSGHQDVGGVRQRFAMFRAAKDEKGLAEYLASFHARMWDVSAFMKMLKQRFSSWYNVRAGRKGTLWEERFKSVLVEGAGEALTTMAAYIDLNPVRAGMVTDPKDYRWSGYGEAAAGKRLAKLGLQKVVTALRQGQEEPLSRSLEVYREWVYREGDEGREGVTEDGKPQRRGIKREEVLQVLAAKGRLPASEYVRCRVRYFCDGAVLGSREFVEAMFKENRDRFRAKRATGAKPMRGLAESELCTWRDFRARVFG